jgi:hypothetical protein
MILYRITGPRWDQLGEEGYGDFYASLEAATAVVRAVDPELTMEYEIGRVVIDGRQGVCDMMNARMTGVPSGGEHTYQTVWPDDEEDEAAVTLGGKP